MQDTLKGLETGTNESVVSAVDPNSMTAIVGDNPVIAEVARDARQRLEKAVAAIS